MGAPARRSSPPLVPPSSPKPVGGRARSAGGRIPRMTRRGRPGGGPVRLFCARSGRGRASPAGPHRPRLPMCVRRPSRAARGGPTSTQSLTMTGTIVPGGPDARGRADRAVRLQVPHPRGSRFGRQTRCRHPRGRPAMSWMADSFARPVPPPARPPHPRGSRFGDVTWARIAPGGLTRIERGRIPSRWARTARGGVDRVALSSHYASRTRLRAPPVRPT